MFNLGWFAIGCIGLFIVCLIIFYFAVKIKNDRVATAIIGTDIVVEALATLGAIAFMVTSLIMVKNARRDVAYLDTGAQIQALITYSEIHDLEYYELEKEAYEYNLKLREIKEDLEKRGNWSPYCVEHTKVRNYKYILFENQGEEV